MAALPVQLTVRFYGKTVPLQVPLKEPLSCEDVCIQCANHLSENLGKYFREEKEQCIGPLLLPMFGLYAADHTLKRWIPDALLLDSQQEFYFRIKVRPIIFKDNIPQGVFADYLFWQCSEDFMRGRIWDMFPIDMKVKTTSKITDNASWILIASAQYSIKADVDSRNVLHTDLKALTDLRLLKGSVTLRNLMKLVPKVPSHLKKEYNIKNPFMYVLSYFYLRSYIKDVFEEHGTQNLKDIRLSYVKDFIKTSVPYYGLEMFSAQRMALEDSPAKFADLIVRPHQEGCMPGLYSNKVFLCHLKDIYEIYIEDSEVQGKQKCHVHLRIMSRQPLIFVMDNKEMAESFVSILVLYRRLKVNYYDWLNMENVAAPSLQLLLQLKSFGPMSEDAARSRLATQRARDGDYGGDSAFLIYQDVNHHWSLHALGLDANGFTDNYDIDLRPASPGEDVCMCISDTAMDSASGLLRYLTATLQLGRHIKPDEEEICGAMQFMKDDNETAYSYAYDDMDKRQRRQNYDRPNLYMEDEIAEKDRIVRGEFSDVYRCKDLLVGRDAILKVVTSKAEKVHNAYREGAEHVIKLQKQIPYFIQVYGMMSGSSVQVVFESLPQERCSLLFRLQDHEAPPLNCMQISSVLCQLAECLCCLKEQKLLYGSLCCAKILIVREQVNKLTIRLGDPSYSMYLDKLPVSDRLNLQRLAWVAPERRGSLGKHTLSTEVFSFGVTVWQILHCGLDPLESIPTSMLVSTFFEKGGELPDPVFGASPKVQGLEAGLGVGEGGDCSRQAQQRTHTWVQSQNASQTTPPPQQIAEYNKVDLASLHEGGSAWAQTARPSVEGGGGRCLADSLHGLQQEMVQLMRRCLHIDPDSRPSPRELLKASRDIEKQADDAVKGNELWQTFLCLKVAREKVDGQDPEQARQREQRLLANIASCNRHADELRLKDTLQKELKQYQPYIDFSLLDFSASENLGKGNFGEVVSARLLRACETVAEERVQRAQGACKVAVKTLMPPGQQSSATLQTIFFLREALSLCNLKHPNVVALHGIVMPGPQNNNHLLVMEFANGGALDKFIQKSIQWDNEEQLIQLAVDVANGMDYISKQKRVHCDLAARNVLLFYAAGNALTAKLADFGLSRKLDRGANGIYYYSLGQSATKPTVLPVYCMAKECIDDLSKSVDCRLSSQTDVWMFGVLLWEMFSVGDPCKELCGPPGADPTQHLHSYLEEGGRLPRQPSQPGTKECPRPLYQVMVSCWDAEPGLRPTFAQLADTLLHLPRDL